MHRLKRVVTTSTLMVLALTIGAAAPRGEPKASAEVRLDATMRDDPADRVRSDGAAYVDRQQNVRIA